MMMIIIVEDKGNYKWNLLLVVVPSVVCVCPRSCNCVKTTLRNDPSINGCITALGNDLRLMDVDFGGLDTLMVMMVALATH
jgi:hypothetical protein